MAIIDLNNLVRPKQTANQKTQLNSVVTTSTSVYTDLHLDLTIGKNIGLGVNPVVSTDMIVDNDIDAIKNSIRNIFTTKKGQKLLNPQFGCSLEQYLFEPVNTAYAKAIGDDILYNIETFEPRIKVNNISVLPQPDLNQYYIICSYTLLEIQKQSILNLIAQIGGQILV